MKTAKNRERNDLSRRNGAVDQLWNGDPLLQSLMGPAPVEVIYVLVEHDVQVALSEDDNVIEALASDAPQKPLTSRIPDRWAAERDGFSVHAGVSFSALDRRGGELLCRYMLRPAIATERVSILRDGSIGYRTKYKLRSGASARVMTPIEFLCRMAALVPPPRIPLLRYHGCLAAASPLRKLLSPAQGSYGCEHGSNTEPAAPAPVPQKPLRQLDPAPAPQPTPRSARSSVYIPWSVLLARTFGVDSLQCPRCKKGRLRPIAVITKEEIVSKILAHLRLPVSPEMLADECTVVYDVSDQPIPGWVVGADPEPPEQEARGPPCDGFEGIDPVLATSVIRASSHASFQSPGAGLPMGPVRPDAVDDAL